MELFRRLVRRYKRADPLKADALLAALFIAAQLVEAAVLDPEGQSRLATAVFGSLTLAALAWRRRSPMLAAIAFGAGVAVQDPLNSFFFGPHSNAPFIAALLMAYSVGRHLDGRRLWAAVAALLAGILSAVLQSQSFEGAGDVIWIFLLFTPPLLAGRAIRSRVALRRELRAKAEQLEADGERDAQAAVEDERSRIATELQAVVANGVSAMVIQAEAVPVVLAAGDTERARQSFQEIEDTGRDALTEMRRLLGVLRRDGDRAELAPQPGLGRLEPLVERLREGGLDVELTVAGEPRDLASGVDLTAYRVMQEALEAAAGAGAARAAVLLRWGARDLQLEVSDDRPAAGDDDPIVALRERVGLYGGHVRAIHPEGGEYLLEARLPAPAGAASLAGGRS